MLLRRAVSGVSNTFILGRGLPIQMKHLDFNNQRFNIKSSIINSSILNPYAPLFPQYCFSTTKKSPKNSQKKTFKILKTSMIPGQNIFLLYDGQKQQRSFQIISGLFIMLFGLSLVKLYYTESDQRKDDYIILLIVAGSFIVYQRRILKTLKKVTLNYHGDKLNITTFNLLGKGQRTMQAPVQIMTGIYRATRLGGYMLKGGGKSSLYKEMKFWLTKQYVTDQPTFQYVSRGKIPKVVDQYQSL